MIIYRHVMDTVLENCRLAKDVIDTSCAHIGTYEEAIVLCIIRCIFKYLTMEQKGRADTVVCVCVWVYM
jgi:hypothetical protein